MHRFLTGILFIAAFILESPAVLLAGAYVYSIGYLYLDFRGLTIRRLDMSSLFAFGLLLHAISHTIAISVSDPVSVRYFLLLYKPQHLFEGLAIFHVGGFVILESLRYYSKVNMTSITLDRRMPQWWQTLVLSIIFFLISKYLPLASYGTIGSLMNLLVLGSLLFVSFQVHIQNRAQPITFCLIYVGFLSFYAFQTSYLRYEIVLPWVAYFFGELLARKELPRFSLQSKVVAVALLIVIPPLFTYLGAVRSTYSEADRDVATVITRISSGETDDRRESVLTRLSYINQLTNLVNLVRVKGFYEGKTLEYYSFVFIPRFLWPEKPTIAQGQWFALEAGLAYKNSEGRINNSINMTVPGEFYLNFGWPGVLVGCWFFGFFFAFIWNRVHEDSLAGWTFRFLLLFVAISGLGADLQIVATYTAYFLMYIGYLKGRKLLGFN